MVHETKAFILEMITLGKIIAPFKQPKATMWKKDMNRENRTRITNGDNFGFTLGSTFLEFKVSRTERGCPGRSKVS